MEHALMHPSNNNICKFGATSCQWIDMFEVPSDKRVDNV